MSGFQKATRKGKFVRLALMGTAGSGKTTSAIRTGRALIGPEGKLAVVDTERGSASKTGLEFTEFDVLELESFEVKNYIDAIRVAEDQGYHCIVIDSLSHAWAGPGGILEFVDNAAKRSKSGNTYMAWRDATPLHNQLVDAIIGAQLHVIITMRTKTEYVVEKDSRGKSVPRKIGMQPVQRDGLEYEFDVVADMDGGELVITKTRCVALDGKVYRHPNDEVAQILLAWLDGAEDTPPPTPKPPEPDNKPRKTPKREPVVLKEERVKALIPLREERGLGQEALMALIKAKCDNAGNGNPNYLSVDNLKSFTAWFEKSTAEECHELIKAQAEKETA